MNARTYPRTATQAFPNHCDYACALERPPRRYPLALWIVCGIAFAVAVIAARSAP